MKWGLIPIRLLRNSIFRNCRSCAFQTINKRTKKSFDSFQNSKSSENCICRAPNPCVGCPIKEVERLHHQVQTSRLAEGEVFEHSQVHRHNCRSLQRVSSETKRS